MPRTLSPAHAAALADIITHPGYLVELTLESVPTPFRWSSRGTMTLPGPRPVLTKYGVNNVAGNTVFESYDIEPQGITWDGSASAPVTLRIGNLDSAFGIALLDDPFNEAQLDIWAFDSTLNTINWADCLWVSWGAVNAADIAVDGGGARLSARNFRLRNTLLPRRFVTPHFGLRNVTRKGSIVEFKGEKFRLDRGD